MSFIPILLAFAAVVVFVLLFSIFKFSTIKLFSGEIVQIKAKDIPEGQVDVLIEAESFIQKQGFIFKAHVSRGPVVKGQPWGLYGALYFHEATNTWATVYVEPSLHAVFRWRLQLLTPDETHGYIATLSGIEFDNNCTPSEYEVHDALVYSPLEQWRSHKVLLEKKKISSGVSEPQVSDILHANEMIFFKGMVDTNRVVPWGEGYRLPVKQAFHAFKNLMLKRRTLLAQKKKSEEEGVYSGYSVSNSSTESTESQLSAYKTYKQVQESNKGKWLSKTGILLCSVLLFGAGFGLILSLDTVLMLIVVLIIHEAGHLLGMWLFGYRDLRMMFIPFMGALASGKKEQVKTWQEAIILLLGPMPGYVLGVFVLLSESEAIPEWLAQYALMSLILNALNLLPFMPLDGGRVVNLALFNRLPGFQVVLTLLSIAALGYTGMAWGEPAGAVIAVILVISMPHLWKEIKLLKHLLREGVHKNYRGLKQLIEVMSQHPVWKKQLPQNRWVLLDSLSYRVQHANAGIFSSVFTLGLWIATFILPVYLAMPVEGRQNLKLMLGLTTYEDQIQEKIDSSIKEYGNLESDHARAKTALDLSLQLSDSRKDEGHWYWGDLKRLVVSAELTSIERGDLYVQMSYSCEIYDSNDGDCEFRFLKHAISAFDHSVEPSINKISAFYRLAQFQSESVEQRLTYLNRAIKYAEAADYSELWRPGFGLERGKIYEASGDLVSAEQHYIGAVNSAFSLEENNFLRFQRELINFYVRHNNSNAAVKALKKWIAEGRYSNDDWSVMQDSPHYMLVWLLWASEPKEAMFHLQALKPAHAVEEVEYELAKLIMKEQLNKAITADRVQAIAKLVDAVENDYEWYLLANLLIASGKDGSGVDSAFLESHKASVGWYKKMRELSLRPKFASLAAEVSKYVEELEY